MLSATSLRERRPRRERPILSEERKQAVIVYQVGHFYFGDLGQYYFGANTLACYSAMLSIRRRHMEMTAVLTPAEEGGFVAFNPETGTTTQGETVEEAVTNLRDATALYLLEFPIPVTSGRAVVTTFAVPVHA